MREITRVKVMAFFSVKGRKTINLPATTFKPGADLDFDRIRSPHDAGCRRVVRICASLPGTVAAA
jgi:hypothetical protein